MAHASSDDANMDEIFQYLDNQPAASSQYGNPTEDDILNLAQELEAQGMDAAGLSASSNEYVPGQTPFVPAAQAEEPPVPPPAAPPASGSGEAGITTEAVTAALMAEINAIIAEQGYLDLSFKGRQRLFPRIEGAVKDKFGSPGSSAWKRSLGMELRPFIAELIREQEKIGTLAAAAPATTPVPAKAASSPTVMSASAKAFKPRASAAVFTPSFAPAPAPAPAAAPTPAPVATPPAPPAKPVNTTKTAVFFKNGEDHWDENKWGEFFARFGPTESLKLTYRGPKRKGMGTVKFQKVEDANKLMASADDNGKAWHTIDTSEFVCEWALVR